MAMAVDQAAALRSSMPATVERSAAGGAGKAYHPSALAIGQGSVDQLIFPQPSPGQALRAMAVTTGHNQVGRK